MNIVVNKEGIPEQFSIARASGLGMDESAIDAVKQWRFKPAMRNGEPVNTRASIEVQFNLF